MSEIETPTGETTQEHAPSSGDQPGQAAGPTPEEKYAQELAAEKLRADQATMRANQLENERKEDNRKRLEQEGNTEELLRLAREEIAKSNASREAEEAKKFREALINEYPDKKVQEAARKLVEANPDNLVWSENATKDQARAEITRQMDALATVFGEEPKTPQPPVDALNPNPRSATPPLPTKTLEQMGEDIDKRILAGEYR